MAINTLDMLMQAVLNDEPIDYDRMAKLQALEITEAGRAFVLQNAKATQEADKRYQPGGPDSVLG